jgi:phosphoserine phosphatase
LLTVQRSRVPKATKKKAYINQTIAVGDGANDLPMLNLGFGIAFHASNGERKCFLVDFQSWSGWGFVPLGYHHRHIDMMENYPNRVKSSILNI